MMGDMSMSVASFLHHLFDPSSARNILLTIIYHPLPLAPPTPTYSSNPISPSPPLHHCSSPPHTPPEKQKMRNKCKKIIDHGISCFINRQLIYNFPEQIFTEAGVVSIEHADFDGIERIAAVTGGEIASTFDR